MKNHHQHMNDDLNPSGSLRLSLAAIAISTIFGATPAIAEPLFQQSIMPKADTARWTDNYVEIGAGGVTTDSASGKAFKFGEYTGVRDEDPFAIVGFNWIFHNRNNDALYLRTNASNLGLETRKFALEGGKQGTFDLSFSADRLLRSEIESAKFILDGLGTSTLTNPTPRPAAANKAYFDANTTKAFEVKQGRDIYRLGLHGVLSANWDFTVNYREDLRDGTRLTGLPYNTGARSALVVPYEINDKTQQVEATLAYQSKAFEAQLAYSYSRYENNLDRLRVENVNTSAATAATTPVAQMSLAPDNDYHQINLTGAYNFTRNTRLKTMLSYGEARQNETFLPYNSAGVMPAITSLNGKMINTVADISLLTKPLDDMNFKMGYQYRDVDNQTPRNTYVYFSRDTTTAPSATTPGANQRKTAPVSTTEQRLSFDADYQLTLRTQLRAQLEHTVTDYTLSDRTQTKVNKATLDLRRTFSDEFLGNIGYTFTERTGSAYDKNTYFRQTYTGTFANPTGTQNATQAGTLTNHPSMRSFMYNDYDEHRVRAGGNWVATETISAGASVDAYDRKYGGKNCGTAIDPNVAALVGPLPDTCLGTRKALGGNLNLDLQWQPDENLMAFTFITLAQSEIDIDGRGPWSKGTIAAPDPTLENTANNWFGKLIYTDQTAGVGTKWQVTPKLELGGQYAYSYGVGKSDVRLQTGTAVAMPDLESKLHNVNIHAKWAYNSKVTFRFNYLYEQLATKDWAYDNFTPTSNSGLLMTGQTSAHYKNHVYAVSVALSTW